MVRDMIPTMWDSQTRTLCGCWQHMNSILTENYRYLCVAQGKP